MCRRAARRRGRAGRRAGCSGRGGATPARPPTRRCCPAPTGSCSRRRLRRRRPAATEAVGWPPWRTIEFEWLSVKQGRSPELQAPSPSPSPTPPSCPCRALMGDWIVLYFLLPAKLNSKGKPFCLYDMWDRCARSERFRVRSERFRVRSERFCPKGYAAGANHANVDMALRAELVLMWRQRGAHVCVPRRPTSVGAPVMGSPALRATSSQMNVRKR